MTNYGLLQVPQQSDSHNCGVYAIVFIICLALFGSIEAEGAAPLIELLKERPDFIRLCLISKLLMKYYKLAVKM